VITHSTKCNPWKTPSRGVWHRVMRAFCLVFAVTIIVTVHYHVAFSYGSPVQKYLQRTFLGYGFTDMVVFRMFRRWHIGTTTAFLIL